MDTLIEVVLFVIGMIVGGVLVVGIILPLFHSLPRSIYWIAKGKLKPRACLTYIWVFFAWTGALVVAVLIVDWLFPQARVYLYNSAGFFYGQWFGLIWYLAMSLSKSGRQRLRENFWDEMKGCLSTPEGDFIDIVRSGMVKTGAMTREEAERLITLDMLRDHVSLPQGEVEIVGEYGKVLAELPGPLRPLSKLPYPKETIRRAIETLLSRSRDPEYRNHLETALLVLDDFVPDEEIPLDEEENTRKWLTSRIRPFASSGSANHMKGNSPMSEENSPIFQVPSQAVEMKVAIHCKSQDLI